MNSKQGKLISPQEQEFTLLQAAISWRASGNRQISLNASAERAFANFRDKKTSYFTIANFRDKNVVFTHFCVDSPALALTALR